MDAPSALAFIVARLQPDQDPALDDVDLGQLLASAGAEDAGGLSPDDDGWVPTYSTTGCYRAIAEGWTIRHGRVIDRFDFTTDGQTFRRSQVLDHIESQRRLWARKVQTSSSTLGRF